MPPVITIPRAAALIGVDRSTLWEWVKTNPEWAACISHHAGRRAYLSTERLRARGFIGANP